MQGSRRIQRLKAQTRDQVQGAQESAKKVVGYLRVSTEDQAVKGHSLDAQARSIRAFADSQSHEVLEIVTDAGVSGARRPEDRPGFHRVIELARARAFSILLVWKFDRLSRNLTHSVTTVNDLREEYGVVLRSVTEPIDTATPMGEIIFALLAGFAAEERRTITRRTLAGKKEKASQGGYSGGPTPLGYERDQEGGLRINAAEAEIVRQVHEMRQQGMPYQAIADILNRKNVPTKRGGKWHPATVRYILDNPKYQGLIEYYFRWEGEAHVLRQGSHEAILPKAA